MERHNYPREIVADIDRVLDEPPISIEAALCDAVEHKRMTAEEANECLEAYLRTLHKTP